MVTMDSEVMDKKPSKSLKRNFLIKFFAALSALFLSLMVIDIISGVNVYVFSLSPKKLFSTDMVTLPPTHVFSMMDALSTGAFISDKVLASSWRNNYPDLSTTELLEKAKAERPSLMNFLVKTCTQNLWKKMILYGIVWMALFATSFWILRWLTKSNVEKKGNGDYLKILSNFLVLRTTTLLLMISFGIVGSVLIFNATNQYILPILFKEPTIPYLNAANRVPYAINPLPYAINRAYPYPTEKQILPPDALEQLAQSIEHQKKLLNLAIQNNAAPRENDLENREQRLTWQSLNTLRAQIKMVLFNLEKESNIQTFNQMMADLLSFMEQIHQKTKDNKFFRNVNSAVTSFINFIKDSFKDDLYTREEVTIIIQKHNQKVFIRQLMVTCITLLMATYVFSRWTRRAHKNILA
jgi:hypothetical protein